MSDNSEKSGLDIQFYNGAMEKPLNINFKNGNLYLYTLPSGWDKPMEDAVVTVAKDNILNAVFLSDGMGGHAGADKAIMSVFDSVKAIFSSKKASQSLRENMLDAIELADQKIKDLKIGAGSTIAAFEIGKEHARSYHAGDSICYFIGSRGKIKYLSMEHSPRGHALESGLVHHKNVDDHVEDHEVSNGLGFDPMSLEVSQKLELNNQDLLFLSSDNIPKLFSEDEIIELIVNGEFEKRADNIHEKLMKRLDETKKDDTSMALFKFNQPK